MVKQQRDLHKNRTDDKEPKKTKKKTKTFGENDISQIHFDIFINLYMLYIKMLHL